MKNTISGGLLLIVVTLFSSTMALASWQLVTVEKFPKKAFAVSPWSPTNNGNPPVESLNALLGVGCEANGNQWVYVKLSESIQNLQSTSEARGITGKLTWENNLSYSAPFNYYDNVRTLFLKAGVDDAISLLRNSRQLILEVSWSDSTTTTFRFELAGSKQAIDDAIGKCKQNST